MAQRRMLSKRISQSKKVNSLSIKAQIVWTWTIPWLDDYGCYEADCEDIKTEVFPKNKSIGIQDINNALSEEEKIGLIKIFRLKGKEYQKYNNFEDFQTLKTDRPKKSDIKGYYEGMELNGIQKYPKEPSGSPEVKLREVKLSKDIWSNFNSFWKVYPKKKAKEDAFKAFNKINPDKYLLDRILAAILASMKSDEWLKDNGKFIPHPATWLNGKRWKDEQTELSSISNKEQVEFDRRDKRTLEQKKSDAEKLSKLATGILKKIK